MTLNVSPPTSGVRPARRRSPGWLLPTGLIVFGLIPIAANALRRVAMAVGPDGSASGGDGGMPLPAVLHVLGATVFVVLGALQFSAGLRGRRPRWHRVAGRLAILGALLAAASGLWLAFAYVSGSSGLLFVFRLLAASGLAAFIVLGFRAIRRRRLPAHRAWMIRAFAIGLGAATQVFTLGFGEQLFGEGELSIALLNGAGWAINLAVAEWAIRRRPRRIARAGADWARRPR
ncbi:DUF2306 domain-containing protein [Microbacterium sp. BK668]|uniref:DUF2306 domain-containing protein n=1 Tax=Microbacterium sp. BK668 TaxID=2512118 RepID=UPI001060AD04|nr:DUF2306 domain-containing protein [Microbacterium sp. BK668]TDN91532.1 putative membrane protein DUF2306 [Microbacterium sp. BK668]